MTYNGIEINEINLILISVMFTFILVIAISAAIWWIFLLFNKIDKKTKEAYKKLKSSQKMTHMKKRNLKR